ncbi:MAG TPA: MarC family protein, partial [Steroidobacteraceae bacterium]|nr:MarC family protein [Steroidobacteraceae bacterium]
VEPLSLVPAFAALTQSFSNEHRRQIAAKAVAVSASICIVFALVGARLLQALGISLSAFRIGAGVLLFLIALDMVFARSSPIRSTTAGEADEVKHRHDISVFPLAFPLMTGPGAMATIMLAFGESQLSWTLFFGQMLAMLVVLLIAWVTMRLTGPMMRVMGVTGANVISRLFGVILAALAVQYIIDGIKGAMH